MPDILIVDDSPIMARLLEYMLASAGYKTQVARAGPDALTSIARHAPSLVFLDVMMPEMDGLEVLRRIRQDPATAALPVVMLTAKAQEADREQALQAGADGYLTKPYSQEQVLLVVTRYCQS
jgi:CheY-like chemotaxis protein